MNGFQASIPLPWLTRIKRFSQGSCISHSNARRVCHTCLEYISIPPNNLFFLREKKKEKKSVIKRLQTFCNLCNLTKEILSGKMSVVLCNYVSLSATQEQSLCQTDLLRPFNVYMQWFGLGVGCCVYICHQNQA